MVVSECPPAQTVRERIHLLFPSLAPILAPIGGAVRQTTVLTRCAVSEGCLALFQLRRDGSLGPKLVSEGAEEAADRPGSDPTGCRRVSGALVSKLLHLAPILGPGSIDS